MSVPKFVIVIICTFSAGVLNIYSQVDSTYIGFFEQEFAIRPYFLDKYTALSHETEDGKETIYRPNDPYALGIGFTYKGISLSGAYGFGFMRDKKRGKTKSLDFQYHYYGRKFVMDLFFQNYKGFFVEDEGNDKKVHNDDIYHLYPDIRLEQYGGFAQYIFNGNKFSYQAAFNQNEKQLKSVGSFLLGGGIYYNRARSDSSLLFNDKSELDNFQFGVSGGYAFTWVINKRVYISASMSVGANVGVDHSGEKDKWKVYPTMFPRISAGYNHDNWSLGVSFVNNRIYILHSEQSKMSFDTGALQFSFTRRFGKAPKFLEKNQKIIDTYNHYKFW
ncbi:hypothetical protein M2451_003183 [Dysgonomonas sp. PFB1-18]|uniref:DUF4421 domain-containing protein n=1 Tax=unclassified Dysgonomonas TaxID=2630389 RepID=UPI0024760B0F|nr:MULTISPECIES: DUF4421 domain-containing protein [unclassified Dysgonomonas]MDH6310226.1 hypothetical protein [Dysgonomonas sp. PF1-14]MDH6340045.1 hypothetical protein [Dysgonomonas sp. PF1-16]MDH6381848.1 hypothetical protein [Dysgonomonas sp. PFB1-18]MDH6398910.1 hypothetical protein [Dysgonomonas sp. PF1-23]